jgi:23S rRNA A2030 N6-methylase RlmJ
MNGCALLVVGAPKGLVEDLRSACGWVATQLGETGAQARIWSVEH